jgi:hypothetical protein
MIVSYELFFGKANVEETWPTLSDINRYDVSFYRFQSEYFIRYPIYLSETKDLLRLYPLIGCSFSTNFPNNDHPLNGDNQFWLKSGINININVSRKIFLCPELLYGFRLWQNKWDYVEEALSIETQKSRLGHGLNLKLGAGFRFREN